MIISPHPSIAKQSDRASVVELHKDIHIAQWCLFAAGEGAEKPSLQDGSRLEIVGYYLGHRFGAHRLFFSDFNLQNYNYFPIWQNLIVLMR